MNFVNTFYYLNYKICQFNNKSNDRQSPLVLISIMAFANLFSSFVILFGDPIKNADRNESFFMVFIPPFLLYLLLSKYFLKNNKSREIVRFYKDKSIKTYSYVLMVMYIFFTLFMIGTLFYILIKRKG